MNVQIKLLSEKDKVVNGCGPIYMISYYEDMTLKLSLKMKCSLEKIIKKVNQNSVEVYKFWDEKKGRYTSAMPEAFQLNSLLDIWEEKVKKFVREYAITHNGALPTPEQIKEGVLTKREIKKRKGFWDMVDRWLMDCRKEGIEEKADRKVKYQFKRNKSKKKAENTVKNYVSAMNHLRSFERNYYKKLKIEEFTDEVFDNFLDYMFEVKDDYHPNTVWTWIKSFRTFFQYVEEEHEFVLHRKHAKMEWSYIESEKNHLTPDELVKLSSVNLAEDLVRIRDSFLFACVTSPRDSDLRNFKKENLIIRPDGSKALRFFPKKSNSNFMQSVRVIEVSLNDYALRILEKYNWGIEGRLLPMTTNQHMNEKIKEICKLAGINQMVEKVFFENGEPKIKFIPKYLTISMHTARHTFGVVSFMFGMQLLDVKNEMGHKKLATTEIYLKISKRYSGSQSVNAWNNSGLTLKI